MLGTALNQFSAMCKLLHWNVCLQDTLDYVDTEDTVTSHWWQEKEWSKKTV